MKAILFILDLLWKFAVVIVMMVIYMVLGVALGIILTKLYLWYTLIPIGLYFGIKKIISKWKYYRNKRRVLNVKTQPSLQ